MQKWYFCPFCGLYTIWIKTKRNNLLQLDVFISVGAIQYNINTVKPVFKDNSWEENKVVT